MARPSKHRDWKSLISSLQPGVWTHLTANGSYSTVQTAKAHGLEVSATRIHGTQKYRIEVRKP